MNTRQRITAITIILAASALAATISATAKNQATARTQNAARAQAAAQAKVERGEYLVGIGGCNDCHTPYKLGPNGPEPDRSRLLSGHPENLVMPAPPKMGDGPWVWAAAGTNTAFAGPWGVSYTANLTPDRLTGIGIWDEQLFIKTLRTGRHWGTSRPILPPMPWQNLAGLTDEDLSSIYTYLRSIKPIHNQVPEPVIAGM
jgi:mono/diheme cytochrome c family protein